MEHKVKMIMCLFIATMVLSGLEYTGASVVGAPFQINNLVSLHSISEDDRARDDINRLNAELDGNKPNFCRCDNTRCQCSASSVMRHWTLDQLIKTLPNNISSLYLNNFSFPLLRNDTFQDFHNLRFLSVYNCSVVAIEVDAFKHFENMDDIGLDLELNNITSIIPGTFRHGRSWKYLSVSKNYNLGKDNVGNILHDLKNKSVNDIRMVACGIVIDVLDQSFFEPLADSGLNDLHMNGNTIRKISQCAFEPFRSSLISLYLSNFMYVTSNVFDILSNLSYLRLEGMQVSLQKMTLNLNKLQHLTQLRLNMLSVKPLDLEINNITSLRLLRLVYANNNFDGYKEQVLGLLNASSGLKSVDLSGNLLFQYSDEVLCHLFSNRNNLTAISLTDNYISKLPLCMFRGLFKLQSLLLHKNRLVNLQRDLFQDLYSLKTLDISKNAIVSLDASNFYHMTKLRRLYINENSFDCNCELRPFRDWLSQRMKRVKQKFPFVNYHGEICSKPLSRKLEFVQNFTIPWIECNRDFVMRASFVSIGCILFCVTVTLVLLKYFWKDILYKRMIQRARNHNGYSPIQDIPIEYDAFVSYHSEKQIWIERDLCNQLENGEDIKFKLMYDDRMIPGESIFTSMGEAIHSSRKILFIMSRGWAAAAMNQLEVDMALMKMMDDHRDMIIVLLMEHIPKAEMSEKLRMIVKHNTCFKWSDNERQQSKFWRDLKLELGKHHMD